MTDDQQPPGNEAPPATGGPAAEDPRPDGPKPVRATSRARRIGGGTPPRPAPGRPAAGTDPDLAEPEPAGPDAGGAPVRLSKPRARTRLRDDAAGNEAGASGPAPADRPAAVPMWLPASIALAGTVAAIVFLVLGVLASSGVWWGNTNPSGGQRGAVLAAAKGCMATMNTYDYRKLDQAEKAGLACTTGKLTAQYKTAFQQVVRPQAPKVQGTQTAQILNAGVETVSPDGTQWTVLVFGQLSITNSATGTKTPRLDLFSARAVLQQADGHWRIASYDYAPSS